MCDHKVRVTKLWGFVAWEERDKEIACRAKLLYYRFSLSLQPYTTMLQLLPKELCTAARCAIVSINSAINSKYRILTFSAVFNQFFIDSIRETTQKLRYRFFTHMYVLCIENRKIC